MTPANALPSGNRRPAVGAVRTDSRPTVPSPTPRVPGGRPARRCRDGGACRPRFPVVPAILPRRLAPGLLALGLACAGHGGRPSAPADRRALWLDPGRAEWRAPAPPVSRLRFETTRGTFVLELVRAWGPLGVDRVFNLARLGYYDDTRFHRVRAGYIAQFGLHGDSAVNAAWKGRYLPDDPPRSRNARGTFALAYEGPGRPATRNTQVYVNLGDNARNDAEPFTVLGTVVEGMAVLDSLYAGYGEESGGGVRQGRQGPLERGGNAYMDRTYPRLDRILRVTVVKVPGA